MTLMLQCCPFHFVLKCLQSYEVVISDDYAHIDRELAQFIYVREVKRFDPSKASLSTWYIYITIAGSLGPVRLAQGPFSKVEKNDFIYAKADIHANDIC